MSVWSAKYSLFAKCLTAVLAVSIIGSCLATDRLLRYTATGIAVFVIIVWVLAGLMKVVFGVVLIRSFLCAFHAQKGV